MSDRWLPVVSLVIPCRNEADTIPKVLDSLVQQDYPAHLIELIIVDGMSSDGTLAAVEQFLSSRQPGFRVHILQNLDRITPKGLNMGIRAATGDVVFTLGAHTCYSSNYVSGALATMARYSADAVGSMAVTLPGANTLVARAISLVLSSRLGVGGSRMRLTRPAEAAPEPADTASCPAYRREVFERIGLFDENLIRNQDIEFNTRLRRAGLRLLLDPGIKSFYTARATIAGLCRYAFANGFWSVTCLRSAHRRGSPLLNPGIRPRHLVPGFAAASGLLLTVGSLFSFIPAILLSALVTVYLGLVVTSSLQLIRRSIVNQTRPVSRLKLFATICLLFPVLHSSYGIGSLRALFSRCMLLSYRRRPGRMPVIGSETNVF